MRILKFIILLMLLPGAIWAEDAPPLLPMPTGNYSVGYHDYHWINASVCPDPFYSAATAQDFSKEDVNHCREMMVRVYYPSLAPKILSTAYDPASIQEYKNFILQNMPNFPRNILNTLDAVATWDTHDAPFAGGTFPVVIFSPGYGTDETNYVSLIDELVSQGYIVVALNNTFVSDSVSFPGGPTVVNDDPSGRRTATMVIATEDDINFVLSQIFALHNAEPLFQAMQLNHIGVFGHSLGADMGMYLGHTQATKIQALVALDPYDETSMGITLNYQLSIPFLVMHADSWFAQDQHTANANLNANSYFVVLTQMRHMNFSDLGFFPNQNAFYDALHMSANFYNALYAPEANQLGQIDGARAISIENAYIVQFFNHYLKSAPLGWLQNPVRAFPEVSGVFIGPATVSLPNSWPN